MIEFLIEIILELTVGWGVEVANDCKLPRKVRIGWLVFVTLVYLVLVGLCVWLVITSDYVWGRVLSAGVVLFLVGMFVHFWRKVLKAKEEIKSERV